MTFRDLKLPKELSKKKKLELYKCWILDPLDKGSEPRKLQLNTDYDRYGLSEKAAISLAINEFKDYLLNNPNNVLDFLSQKCVVIFKVTLSSGTMDEDIIQIPNNTNLHPDYDPINELVNVTIDNRASDYDLKNYLVTDIKLELDENTNILSIKDISLEEQVINKSVTGGK